MRVLMITDFYHPFVGGVEQHVRSLSTCLVQRGHHITVATLWHPGLTEFEIDEGIHIYRLRGTLQRIPGLFGQRGRRWAPPFPDPEIVRSLSRLIEREQPQIVHGHDWLARSYLPLKRATGPKFVMSLHYYTVSCANKLLMHHSVPCSGPGFIKCMECASRHYGRRRGTPIVVSNWLMSGIERSAVDMFLPVSTATAAGNNLVSSSTPYRVIPNFVADDIAVDSSDLEPYISQLPGANYLLFVGDLGHHKGLDVLLRVYSGLKDAPPLVLIGKVVRDTPSTFPSGTIVLKEWPHEAVLAAMRRCAALIVPSTWPEPFGIVILEAMACGKPVIASRIGGIPDVVIDGETGLLVPPDDHNALRESIADLLADSERTARMGQAALTALEQFRSRAVVPRIEQVYRDLL
jgi:glycosyltransferase involved in cell wall biosynthesis